MLAKPPGSQTMHSLGNAAYMLLKQHKFPNYYDEKLDKITGHDHDRIRQEIGLDKFQEICKRHTGSGDAGIGSWCKTAWPKNVLAFLVELLGFDNSVKWTGWRVLGTVNRSSGYPVFSLEISAKHPDSKTKVYSGNFAPNVEKEETFNTRDCGGYGRLYRPFIEPTEEDIQEE